MSTEHVQSSDPRIATAVQELEALIAERYPATTFDVFQGEDPEGVYLRATVDLEDTNEVLDVVLDRLYDFQVEQGLPIHVVTTIPLERVADQLRMRDSRPAPRIGPHQFQR
ncbi:MAG: hypothetical protein HYX51_01525 [Chloroflexi bacterium]|nr:hypothetical protein [Chloroflexota bacterium]